MTREIALTQGFITLVDDEDYESAMAAGPWHVKCRKGRSWAVHSVWRSGRVKQIHLHNFLTGWPLVDHINGNPLDNRRANLRPATTSQNGQNRGLGRDSTSGFKGVTRHKKTQKWQAQITAERRLHYLGLFLNPEEAAHAYDAAAREMHGEFACLNFPRPGEQGVVRAHKEVSP